MMSASGNKQWHVVNVGLLVAFRNISRAKRWTARDNCRASDIGLMYTHTNTHNCKQVKIFHFFLFLFFAELWFLRCRNTARRSFRISITVSSKWRKENATNASYLSRNLPFCTLYTDIFRGTRVTSRMARISTRDSDVVRAKNNVASRVEGEKMGCGRWQVVNNK